MNNKHILELIDRINRNMDAEDLEKIIRDEIKADSEREMRQYYLRSALK